jgi:DNA-binding IscR family transcriptional regulator
VPGLCTQESACTVRANWQTINQIVLDALSRVTLEQMMKPIPQNVPLGAIRRKPAGAIA